MTDTSSSPATTEALADINEKEIEALLTDLALFMKNQKWPEITNRVKLLLTECQPNPKLKNAATHLLNSVQSIKSAVDSRALSPLQARPELAEVYKKAKEEILDAIDRMKPPAPLTVSEQKGVGEYDGEMDLVQVKLNTKGFFFGYLSVLPICSPPLDSTKCRNAGFVVSDIEGYTVLKRQLVVGVSREWIKSHVNRQTTEKQAFEEVVDSVKKRFSNLNLVEMSQPIGWYGSLWVWLAPAGNLQLLKKSTISSTTVSSLTVNRWSFPFIKTAETFNV